MLFSTVSALTAAVLTSLPWATSAYNSSSVQTPQSASPFSLFNDRPKDCPPCFNCNLDAFECTQFSQCRAYDGKCECPSGFGGDDCLEPLCGSLADGKERYPRNGKSCECADGWAGINCNVCTNNKACSKIVGSEDQAVCYQGGLTVKENFQMCDVRNRKILDQLGKDKPQVTFSCNTTAATCGFQFWVAERESFYCALDECEIKLESSYDKNVTHYDCTNIKCKCVPSRMLCGEAGSIDISDFLTEEIKGPAQFSCSDDKKGGPNGNCYFSEPAMNGLIKNVFGDPMIFLECGSGECLHFSEVPGYVRPIKEINKPLIATAIAGSALFIVLVIIGLWHQSRMANQRATHGTIHLPYDEEDDVAKLMADHKPAALMFDNVSYNVNGKQILSGVCGVVHPGQLMAIMGASGAGKTTFLDILARKNKRGAVGGNFYINGEVITNDEFRNVIGFVDQEDAMMPTLTVYETILNSALLRLPRDMNWNQKNERVLEVMSQLGISHIKGQLIGSEESGMRGISGGEKRRVGIACELVTSPSILFLDEPTSGLDAFNAYNVIECLVALAKNYNRTVIFTIHQPRSNIVALFDQLVLLAKGRMVYSGEYEKCQNYFDELGYACPPGFNIADYLVDLTMHVARSEASTPPNEPAVSNGNSIGPSNIIGTENRPDQINKKGRKRGDSIRARQERQLFGGRSTNQPPIAVGEEVALDEDTNSTWRETRNSFDDTDHLLPPPPAASANRNLNILIEAYARSSIAGGVKEEIRLAIGNANGTLPHTDGSALGPSVARSGTRMKGHKRLGWTGQFMILSARTWKNLYRNPMLMLTHYAIAIVLAVLCGYLFYGISDNIASFQNRMGLFFFVLALFGFSTLTSLAVFANERLLFLRERANGYYAPITYFASKVIFDIIPLRVIPPIILGTIIYPMVGLVPQWSEFFRFILVLVLFNLSASAICLFIGIIVKEGGVANLIGSLVMLFSLLMAGLLLNKDTIPRAAQWLQKLSIFHYGFEALLVNEVRFLSLHEEKLGLVIDVPGATILSSFGFQTLAFWDDVISLAIFSAVFITLAYAAMHFLLVEKR